ncbi:hypothetical protein GXW78_15060 [Roseomonas terrae]|uniref:Uncharacterized protein n=1 Tax=Neoroseomonas terrae TaxID=424799 RepID=A0ABS5EIY7_9PROT|nr:hypothetical protein [Neoroseomonas terrae]MBR0650991.1 hypothetical protein [Neoroseomonas terrae]
MMAALDAMPWAMPALLTLLVGTGAILRRGHGAGRKRAASIVMGVALALGAVWIVASIALALRAID